MKDKTEELRLDIFHNAPLPNNYYKQLTFQDCGEMEIVDFEGNVLCVTSYEVVDSPEGYKAIIHTCPKQ